MSILSVFKKDKKDQDKAIVNLVDSFFDDTKKVDRQTLERTWFRNILYLMGEQWIEYLPNAQTFRRKLLPTWVPTPVSNEIQDTVEGLIADFLNQKVVPKITPNSDEKADVDAAKIGEAVIQSLDESGDFDDEKEVTALWMLLSGVGWIRTLFDTSLGVPLLDPETSDPLGVGIGDVEAENIMTFGMRVDPLLTKPILRKARWVGCQTIKSLEWVKDKFPDSAKKLKPQNITESSIFYQKRLAQLVANVSPWKGVNLDTAGGNIEDEDVVIYRDVEFAPTPQFPRGRRVIVANDKKLYEGDLPILTDSGRWAYSFVDFHYSHSPGRFWSKGAIDDLISPQDRINRIDGALEFNRKSLGNPQKMVPSGSGVKKHKWTGKNGIVVEYDPRMAAGQKPEILRPEALPNQVIVERELCHTTIENVSGRKDVLKGNAPSGVRAGIALDMLREAASERHTPHVGRFNRSLTKVYRNRLVLAGLHYTEPRVVKIAGRGNTFKVKRIVGADLLNNFDVRLELDSGLSKTRAGTVQLLFDFAKEGFLGDIVGDPELRQELLNRVGLTRFAVDVSADIVKAQEENSMMEDSTCPFIFEADPRFEFDDHMIHVSVHGKDIKSTEFLVLHPEIQLKKMNHINAHMQVLQTQKAAALAEAEAIHAQKGGSPPGEVAEDKISGGLDGGAKNPGV